MICESEEYGSTPFIIRRATRRTSFSSTSFEMADPLFSGIMANLGPRNPDEFKTVPIGSEGYTTAGSTLFYSGRFIPRSFRPRMTPSSVLLR